MKYLIFAIFALVAVAQGARDWSKIKPKHPTVIPRIPAIVPRVVGGQIAEPHGIPFQVALISGGAFCGGTIIRDDAVLTAAHCVDGAPNSEVIAGAHNVFEDEPDQQHIESKIINVHEDWDPFTIKNDIAVVLLSEKLKLDHTAKVVTLNRDSASLDGKEAIVSGWGRYSDASNSLSSKLRYAVEHILSNNQCRLYFGSYVTNGNICLDGSEGKGACNGDSGGPLFIKRNDEPVQAGIVSFGSAAGCEKGFPSVFTKVSEFNDWIDKQLK